ncbi:MAG: TRAP transporter small permease subunit [Tistlia sp.]|uniref:TRAP transporter small permease subunit n=1 Tax=Tistlia sp. TaxID=3057121 RepID=UPI0034A3FD16
MNVLCRFARGITRLNDRIGAVAAYLVLPIFALLLLEVGLRYWLGRPAVWTGELAQMLFGAYALLSGAYLLVHSGHANVDILHGALPPRARAAVDVATSVLLFVFIGALLYFGSSIAWQSTARLETSMSAWNPPIWPLKLLIPIAALLVLLQGLAKLIADLQALGLLPADEEVLPEAEGQEKGL